MPTLEEALTDAIAARHAGLLGRRPGREDVGEIASMYGTGRRANPELARYLARETGRSYGGAIRQIQRWQAPAGRQRRGVGRVYGPALPGAARFGMTVRFREPNAPGGVRVTITGDVRISEECRERTVRAIIPADSARPFLDAFARGRPVGPPFVVAFRRAYSNVPLAFEDCEGGDEPIRDLTLEPVR